MSAASTVASPSPSTEASFSLPEVLNSPLFRQINVVLGRAVKYFACFELLSLILLYANTTNFRRTCTGEPDLTPSEEAELQRLAETLENFGSPTQENLSIVQRCGGIFMMILLTGYWSALTLKILTAVKLIRSTGEGVEPIKSMRSCRIWIMAHLIWLAMMGVILSSVDPEGISVWTTKVFPTHAFGLQVVAAFMITGKEGLLLRRRGAA